MNVTAIKQVFIKGLAKTKEYSPTILTVMAVGGVITTTVLACDSTLKAREILDNYLIEEGYGTDEVEVPTQKKVELCWKTYIPVVVSGSLTIACMVGAHAIDLKRNAAIASLYAISEGKIKDLDKQIEKFVDPKTKEKIKEGLAEDQLINHDLIESQVQMTGRGDFLCLDSYTGVYFKSDIDFLRKVENLFNKRLIGEYSLSLNDLYEMLDLDYTGVGDRVGWTSDHLMEFDFTTRQAKNGEPCLVIDYKAGPSFMFRN